MRATLFTYWRWVVGPMPVAAAIVLLACARRADGVGRATRGLHAAAGRGVVCAAAAAVPAAARSQDGLLPRGAGARHRDAGHERIAWCGGSALRCAVACIWHIALYAATSAKASWTAVRLAACARGEGGGSGARSRGSSRRGAGKIILLDGMDTDLFWSGVADLPFRAKGSAERVSGAGKRIADSGGAGTALEVRAARRRSRGARSRRAARWCTASTGSMLHDVTARAGAQWPAEDEARFVKSGRPGVRRIHGRGLGAAWRMLAGA